MPIDGRPRESDYVPAFIRKPENGNRYGFVFGISLGTADYMPLIFVLAPGAFLVLGYLMVLFNKLAKK